MKTKDPEETMTFPSIEHNADGEPKLHQGSEKRHKDDWKMGKIFHRCNPDAEVSLPLHLWVLATTPNYSQNKAKFTHCLKTATVI